MEVLTTLAAVRAMAVLRSAHAGRLAAVAHTLVDAGLPVVEFALTTPGALGALAAYRADAPPEVCLGAGTVLSASQARQAVEAGAAYLVTPTLAPEVVAEGSRLGVPVLCGALTPTEILAATEAGAAAVKVFPASTVGPGYLRAVLAPLAGTPLVPTGGIGVGEAIGYLEAGAVAVAMGSQLVGDACEGGDLRALGDRTRQLVAELTRGGWAEGAGGRLRG